MQMFPAVSKQCSVFPKAVQPCRWCPHSDEQRSRINTNRLEFQKYSAAVSCKHFVTFLLFGERAFVSECHIFYCFQTNERGGDGETNGKRQGQSSYLAGLQGLNLEALGIPEQAQLTDLYREAVGRENLIGVTGRGVAEFGLAFIFFKMAVIAHGVKACLARGVATSSAAAVVSAMVPRMMSLSTAQISALPRQQHKIGSDERATASEDTDCDDNDDDDGVAAGGSGCGGGDSRDRICGGTSARGEGGDLSSGETVRATEKNAAVVHRPRGQQSSPRPKLRAVLFDVGGVPSESPLLAIARFEREARPKPLPPSYIGAAISAAGEDGLFQKLERGDEKLGPGYLSRFSEYLCSEKAKQAYVDHAARRARAISESLYFSGVRHAMEEASRRDRNRWAAAAEEGRAAAFAAGEAEVLIEAKKAVAGIANVDVLALFRCIAAASRVPVPEMIAAAEELRRRGVKVAAVSNDFLVEPGFVLGGRDQSDGHSSTDTIISSGVWGGGISGDAKNKGRGSVYALLPSLCDAVVLSSTIGCRKPAPRIYQDACALLGVFSPSEAVFVDDIRANVRAAKDLGMRAVWVQPGGAVEIRNAIEELEAVTGVTTLTRARWEAARGTRQPIAKL